MRRGREFFIQGQVVPKTSNAKSAQMEFAQRAAEFANLESAQPTDRPSLRTAMKVPEFSEFTFGYALTDNLVNGALSGVRGVPLFPSLKEEGQRGVGYDVKIPRFSTPLFLQFKLPQVVRQHRNVWKHNLTTPYYRMHLMRSSDSPQHRSLLRLARGGKDVFYVAPEFHTRRDLNTNHARRKVPLHSAFFDPKDIGDLSDGPHHVAYKRDIDTAWVCSEPRRLEWPCGGDRFISWLEKRSKSVQRIDSPELFFVGLAHEIVNASLLVADRKDGHAPPSNQEVDSVTPAEIVDQAEIAVFWGQLKPHQERLGHRLFAGFLSRLLLDCELVMVGHGEDI